MDFLKKQFTILLLPVFSLAINGCQSSFISERGEGFNYQAEMYAWRPPGPKELEARRIQQKEIDEISAEVENVFLNMEESKEEERSLRVRTSAADPRMREMERRVQVTSEVLKEKYDRMAADLAQVKSKAGEIDSALAELGKPPPQLPSPRAQYSEAISLFKDGKYKESLKKFKELLGRKPPRTLMDDIHFGIGSLYFKLKDYRAAITHFKTVVEQFSKEDKWPLSNVLLGLSYNLLGENSQAIYFLQEALKKELPDAIRSRIKALLDKMQ